MKKEGEQNKSKTDIFKENGMEINWSERTTSVVDDSSDTSGNALFKWKSKLSQIHPKLASRPTPKESVIEVEGTVDKANNAMPLKEKHKSDSMVNELTDNPVKDTDINVADSRSPMSSSSSDSGLGEFVSEHPSEISAKAEKPSGNLVTKAESQSGNLITKADINCIRSRLKSSTCQANAEAESLKTGRENIEQKNEKSNGKPFLQQLSNNIDQFCFVVFILVWVSVTIGYMSALFAE